MTAVTGLDPVTDEVLTVGFDSRITRIERCPRRGADELPYLARGMVDLQVNGFGGVDVNRLDDPVADLVRITRALRRRGVTSWVPTVISAPEQKLISQLSAISSALAACGELRESIPFAHVEGPFVSDAPGTRGVHEARFIRPLDAEEVARWTAAGPVGIVTVSPHRAGDAAHVARIVARGVRVGIGHTEASRAQILAAVDEGATLSTHLGNGIAELIARHPNPIWSQLAEPRLTCGLIADGHHLPAETLVAMVRAKGADGAFLVSDSIALAGLPPGDYETVVGGRVRLAPDRRLSSLTSGTLAGSASDLADGLRFALASGLRHDEVVGLVSRIPAQIAGLTPELAIGAPADLVAFDRGGSVVGVWKRGVRADG